MTEDNTAIDLSTRFKDGDDGGDTPDVMEWKISVVDNGYIVTTFYDSDDYEPAIEVFHNLDDVFKSMQRSH